MAYVVVTPLALLLAANLLDAWVRALASRLAPWPGLAPPRLAWRGVAWPGLVNGGERSEYRWNICQ